MTERTNEDKPRTNLGQAEDRKRTREGPHRQKVQLYLINFFGDALLRKFINGNIHSVAVDICNKEMLIMYCSSNVVKVNLNYE